jgi:hypothetical protein
VEEVLVLPDKMQMMEMVVQVEIIVLNLEQHTEPTAAISQAAAAAVTLAQIMMVRVVWVVEVMVYQMNLLLEVLEQMVLEAEAAVVPVKLLVQVMVEVEMVVMVLF